MKLLFLVALAAAACVGEFAPCAETELPVDSLYQLRVPLLSQRSDTVSFDLDRGHPTLVSMFYGSCPAACPMLVNSMQVYESQLDPASRGRLRVLLVSFDAERDTPPKLEEFARLHRTDPARWTFASASETDARKLAALLGLRYRQLPDGNFDHSLVITLLDPQGRVLAATATLVGDSAFLAKLQSVTAADAPASHLPSSPIGEVP
jgi:protein SCO1